MQFSKMHEARLAAIFMVVDAVTQNVFFAGTDSSAIRRTHRRKGLIGYTLVVEPPHYDPELDFHCRIFNADGSEVLAVRQWRALCFARFCSPQRANQ